MAQEKSKLKSKPNGSKSCLKIKDNISKKNIVPPVSTDKSNDIDIWREENDNDAITPVTHIYVVNDTEIVPQIADPPVVDDG